MTRPLLQRLADSPLLKGQLPVLAGLLVPLAYGLGTEGASLAGRLVAIGLVAIGWQVLFARIRGQGFGLEGLVLAIVVALLVPTFAPLWHLVLGTSFGMVIGLLVFGGYGRNILHPAVVTLAFLMFSFPAEGYRDTPMLALWTLAPALVLLLASGQANWRIIVGALVGLMGLGWLQQTPETVSLAGTGLFWLVLLFLVADPVASAATNWGRLAYGLLFGVLVALFLQAGSPFSALVFATLMASIFAPLLDQLAIALNVQRRARRHG